MNSSPKRKLNFTRAANGVNIFVLALAFRLFYVFFVAQRQLCGFNDQANFDCAAAICAAEKAVTAKLTLPQTIVGQYVGSLPLQDVLVKNGPVYPFYLALQMQLFGLKPGADASQFNCLPFVITNLVVDAFACVLVYYTARFAFNKRTATIAAALALVYSAGLANTMHCYPEPLCYFFISAWMCLICSALMRHANKFWTWFSYAGIGALSALIVFTVPTLLLLPVFTGLVLFAFKFGEPLKQICDRISEKMEKLSSPAPPAVPTPTTVADSPTASSDHAEKAEDWPAPPENAAAAAPPAQPSDNLLNFEPDTSSEAAAHADTEVDRQKSVSDADDKNRTVAAQAVDDSNMMPKARAADGTDVSAETGKTDEVQEPQSSGETGQVDEVPEPQGTAETDKTDAVQAQQSSGETTAAVVQAPGTSTPSASPDAAKSPSVVPNYRPVFALLLILIGAAVVTAPWYWLQKSTRLHFDLVSEPILAARIWLGNLSTSEGWRLLPANEFPVSSISVVMHSIFTSMLSIPVPYFALLMQKIARLFAASWNDYQLSYIGLSPLLQNVVHGLILFTAYVGCSFASLKYPRWRLSRSLICMVALASIIVYHLIYCVFHCCSRNAFTAMPAIFVLSGYCLDRITAHIREVRTQFAILLLVAAVFFGWLLFGFNLVPLFSGLISSDVNAQLADLIVVGAAWLFLLLLALPFARLEGGHKVSSATDMLKFGWVLAIMTMIGCGFDERWREWKAELKNEHEIIQQTITLPALVDMPDFATRTKPDQSVFVLIDVQSPFLAPPLAVTVNDVAEVGQLPWLQLKPFDKDSMQDIFAQARGMGVDWRSFRQWWAVPVPFSALKFGTSNVISVSLLPSDGVASHKIYGQYGSATTRRNDSYMMLPSPYTISWEKGFATYAAGDMRLPESIVLQGKVVASSLESVGVEPKADLSFDHGTQTGSYRIRLALPLSSGFTTIPSFESPLAPISSVSSTVQLNEELKPYEQNEALGISAKDEKSQLLTPEPIAVGQMLPAGALFVFQSDIKSIFGMQPASLQIEFSGTDTVGQQIKWTSPWQPDCISVGGDWQTFTFADFIPESVQTLKDPHISIKITPYDNPRLILHPHRSIAQEVAIRKASLMIMPPLAIPSDRERDWMIF